MRSKTPNPRTLGFELVNLQKHYALPRWQLAAFARDLKRALRLGKQTFNVSFVDNEAIRRLNAEFRGTNRPTDVLSFPWSEAGVAEVRKRRNLHSVPPARGISNFLGDIVISVPVARLNAGEEGHSTLNELRWLILHGVLHLLGYDHATDRGEMVALELSLRDRLGVNGPGKKRKRGSKAQTTAVAIVVESGFAV